MPSESASKYTWAFSNVPSEITRLIVLNTSATVVVEEEKPEKPAKAATPAKAIPDKSRLKSTLEESASLAISVALTNIGRLLE